METRVLGQDAQIVAIDAVRSHPKNPRIGSVADIAELIKVNGFYGFLIVQESTGYILAGNHRWQAAMQAGLEEIPVAYVDVDDEHALNILLADNRSADKAGYDEALLAEILSHRAESDPELTGTGYSDDDLLELLGETPGKSPAAKSEGAEAEAGTAEEETEPGEVDPTEGLTTEDSYQEQYGVIVLCADAAEQEAIYNRLADEGLMVRGVVT